MRSVLLLMLAALAGCSGLPGGKAVVVLPLDDQAVLDGKAILLVNANAVKPAEDLDDDQGGKQPVKCLCGGTGRSGDGLGPCACPDGCKCKATRQVEPVPIESEQDDATSEDAPQDAKVSADDGESQVTDPFLEVDDSIEKSLSSLSTVAETLSANQVEITKRVGDHESRIAALESAAATKAQAATAVEASPVNATGFTVDQAINTESPKTSGRAPVKAIVVSQDFCPPCQRMEAIFPSLESSGWRIGSGEDCQIVRIKLTDSVALPEAQDAISRTLGTPNTVFYKDGKFVKSIKGELSAKRLADTINEIATGAASAVQSNSVEQPQVYQMQIRSRLPVVRTPWGTIDLETYQRNCNCPMCQGIRSLQSQYRQTSMIEVVEQKTPVVVAAQQPTPSGVIDQVMDALSLSSADTVADIGCGDGRILIDAVTRFGCNGVGVEIDPAKADEARKRVAEAGLSHMITIVTGDAKDFDPKAYSVTAGVAYLYPDLLAKLRPMLETIPVLITPFHKVEGLIMEQRGDLWVRDVRSVPPLLTDRN